MAEGMVKEIMAEGIENNFLRLFNYDKQLLCNNEIGD